MRKTIKLSSIFKSANIPTAEVDMEKQGPLSTIDIFV